MLPMYEKRKTMTIREPLPRGAYVIDIKGAKEVPNKSKPGSHLAIAFDIKEGPYAGHYEKVYQEDQRLDKKWPNDAVYRLTIPTDDSPSYVWRRWNEFFSDLEDSNGGYVFDGSDLKPLRGKILGGKFAIEETEWEGSIYRHTRLRWTCTAEAVRSGNVGRMPEDKLLNGGNKPDEAASENGGTAGSGASGVLPATETGSSDESYF